MLNIQLDVFVQIIAVIGGAIAMVLAVLEIVETAMNIIDKVKAWRKDNESPLS
jgi:hypothetical protein